MHELYAIAPGLQVARGNRERGGVAIICQFYFHISCQIAFSVAVFPMAYFAVDTVSLFTLRQGCRGGFYGIYHLSGFWWNFIFSGRATCRWF